LSIFLTKKQDNNVNEEIEKQRDREKHLMDKLPIGDGFRSNIYIFDESEDLKRRYSSEQLQKMWEDAYPKLSEISDKVIMTGTPK